MGFRTKAALREELARATAQNAMMVNRLVAVTADRDAARSDAAVALSETEHLRQRLARSEAEQKHTLDGLEADAAIIGSAIAWMSPERALNLGRALMNGSTVTAPITAGHVLTAFTEAKGLVEVKG